MYLVGGAKVEHAPLGQHMDLGEQVPDGRAGLVDGGYHNPLLCGQARHALHDYQRCVGVQAAGGLVQRDDARRTDAAARDAQPPLLPAADPPHRQAPGQQAPHLRASPSLEQCLGSSFIVCWLCGSIAIPASWAG